MSCWLSNIPAPSFPTKVVRGYKLWGEGASEYDMLLPARVGLLL